MRLTLLKHLNALALFQFEIEVLTCSIWTIKINFKQENNTYQLVWLVNNFQKFVSLYRFSIA
jgi:uncharacterized integral membrane protein